MRRFLGRIKRGMIGILQDHLELVPALPDSSWVFGQSAGGRELHCFRVGEGSKAVLLVGAIHGNEVGTVKLVQHILAWLPGRFPELSVYCVPCLNPDGYAEARNQRQYFKDGRVGRLNGNGVDLNRNFPVPSFKTESVWLRGKDYAETAPVKCGAHGGSEPELQALMTLVKELQPAAVFMFHNCGGDVMGNDHPLSDELTPLFAEKSGFKFVDHVAWQSRGQTGTAKEWCNQEGVAFLEVEGRVRWGSDWKNQRAAIEACLERIARPNL